MGSPLGPKYEPYISLNPGTLNHKHPLGELTPSHLWAQLDGRNSVPDSSGDVAFPGLNC